MEKKETKKLTVTILIITLMIVIIGGSTFAYWQWASDTASRTQVNVKVQDSITMTITPSTTRTPNLYPISDANCEANSTAGTALVTISNNTGVKAKPTFYLKVKVEDSNGNNISNTTYNGKTYAEYIHYAVAETSVTSCNDAPVKGAFTNSSTTSGWYDSPTITSGNDFTFVANGKTSPTASAVTTTHTYKYWAWIDPEYTSTTTGTSITDKLQNAKITISWSEKSSVSQVA